MKRNAVLAVLSALVLTAFSVPALAANADLHEMFSKQALVKVFVATPTDSSPEKKTDVANLKAELEKAFTERRSVKFEVVQDAASADITVSTDVLEYFWTDHDPVDMIAGLAGVAYDTATVEKYVRQQANIAIKKGDKVIWSDKIVATITDNGLTPETSFQRINQDMATVLMRAAFAKKKASQRGR